MYDIFEPGLNIIYHTYLCPNKFQKKLVIFEAPIPTAYCQAYFSTFCFSWMFSYCDWGFFLLSEYMWLHIHNL